MQSYSLLEPAPLISPPSTTRPSPVSQTVVLRPPDWNDFGNILWNSAKASESRDDDDSDLMDNLSNCAMPEEDISRTQENRIQSRTIVSWYKKIRKNAKKESKLTIKNINFACKSGQLLYKEISPLTIIRLGDGNYLPVDSSVLNSDEDSRQSFAMASGLSENKRILSIED
jgi:hypothetical protein